MDSFEEKNDNNVTRIIAETLVKKDQKNRKLKELSKSVNFEDLFRLGRAIQNKTRNFDKNRNISDTSQFIAFHIGHILIIEPSTLLDSSSEELLAIKNTVRNFAITILSNKDELNNADKEKVQKVSDMLKSIPELPFKDSNYTDQIQSLNTSIKKFLEQLEQIK